MAIPASVQLGQIPAGPGNNDFYGPQLSPVPAPGNNHLYNWNQLGHQGLNQLWLSYLQSNGLDQQYQQWAHALVSQNPHFLDALKGPVGRDYNYAAAFMAQPNSSSNGHLNDFGKLPNHSTFSNEGFYAPGNRKLAGDWQEPIYSGSDGGQNWTFTAPGKGLNFAPEEQAYQRPTQGQNLMQHLQ